MEAEQVARELLAGMLCSAGAAWSGSGCVLTPHCVCVYKLTAALRRAHAEGRREGIEAAASGDDRAAGDRIMNALSKAGHGQGSDGAGE